MDYTCLYINLESHKHRRRHIKKMLKNLDIPYTRFNAIRPIQKHVEDSNRFHTKLINYLSNEETRKRGIGLLGCYLSHYNVLLENQNIATKHLLLLEDDLKFNSNTLQQLQNIITYLDNNYDWDIFRIIRDKYDNEETQSFEKHIINNIPIYKFGSCNRNSIFSSKNSNHIDGGTYFQVINTKNIPKIIQYLETDSIYNIDALYSTNKLNVFYGFNKDFHIIINLFESSIPKTKCR